MSRYLRCTRCSILSGRIPSGCCSTNTHKLSAHSVSLRTLLKLSGGILSPEGASCLHIIRLRFFFKSWDSTKLMHTLEILVALTYRWRTFLGILTWKSSSIRNCSPLDTDSAISYSKS
ncbi:hypothetical protein SETIT_7G035000v2 [Setaria italica]|uniref:Uncharacterized protein n=2 Tax=Setaria TaxID=4554 RepID=A0A368RRT4_SETIT|nr:hypothetical protein SETIT_7G035000v2 [Setaria italica]TKW03415.1 hypothetical protein SEVIR_7G022000v2 [Setaria viridis]